MFRVQGSGFRFHGLGCRVSVFSNRLQGLQFRVHVGPRIEFTGSGIQDVRSM